MRTRLYILLISLLSSSSSYYTSTSNKCIPRPDNTTEEIVVDESLPVFESSDFNEIPSRFPSGDSCDAGGTFSNNEFGARICEYPASACRITKYFVYAEGGQGVELCCSAQSNCNYDPVKNYCLPGDLRCVDGSFFGCSLKEGPIFDSCDLV